jgi:hypothetical protein
VIGFSTVAWGSLVGVLSIRYGDKDEGAKRIFTYYRGLLASPRFLLVSDFVLLVAVTVIGYQALAYRQVTFTSPVGGKLVLNDIVGAPEVVGSLEANDAKPFRLKIGTRHLAFQSANSIVALPPLNVPPWWTGGQAPEVEIAARNDKYEKVH